MHAIAHRTKQQPKRKTKWVKTPRFAQTMPIIFRHMRVQLLKAIDGVGFKGWDSFSNLRRLRFICKWLNLSPIVHCCTLTNAFMNFLFSDTAFRNAQHSCCSHRSSSSSTFFCYVLGNLSLFIDHALLWVIHKICTLLLRTLTTKLFTRFGQWRTKSVSLHALWRPEYFVVTNASIMLIWWHFKCAVKIDLNIKF